MNRFVPIIFSISLILTVNEAIAQPKTNSCIQIDYLKDKAVLSDSALLKLGKFSEELYKSPIIEIFNEGYYKGSQLFALSEKRNQELLRYFSEEKTVVPIFKTESDSKLKNQSKVCFFDKNKIPNFNKSQISRASNSDTIIENFDNFRIKTKIENVDQITLLRIHELNKAERSGLSEIETLNKQGIPQALLSQFLIYTVDSSDLNYIAELYFPVPAGNFFGKTTIYHLNIYTHKWEISGNNLPKNRINNKDFFVIPFHENGFYSIQYSLQNKLIDLQLIAPRGLAFTRACIKTIYPKTVNFGQISANQQILNFEIPIDFDLEEFSIVLCDTDGKFFQLNEKSINEILNLIHKKTETLLNVNLELKKTDLVEINSNILSKNP